MNSPHQRPGKFGGHPSIAFKKAGEGYEQSKRALGGRADMRLRYSESLASLEGPLQTADYIGCVVFFGTLHTMGGGRKILR